MENGKKGEKMDVCNYRPVSLICGFSKLFEMLLHDYLLCQIEPLLTLQQHGFLRGRSTTTNLACFSQFLAEVIDNSCQVDVVFTDFSKAFDKIDHRIILAKLRAFGLSDDFVSFFQSYLMQRTQYVTYNGFKSSSFGAPSGVPQGSNLGPLLFLIFINDIAEVIDIKFQIFANDLKLYMPIEGLGDCERLQNALNQVQNWCAKNRLLLNASKCSVMTVSKKVSSVTYNYSIDNSLLVRVENTRDLGVSFDSKLSFNAHIDKIISEATQMLGFILRNCKSFTNAEALKSLYVALVRSKLEYNSLIWSPIYNKYTLALEQVQRKFLKYLAFRMDGLYPQRGTDNAALLHRFNFDSLQKRREQHAVIFLYKIFNGGIVCPSLLEEIKIVVPRGSGRSRNYLYLPRANTNVMISSPMYKMCSAFNQVANQCDICMPLGQFVRTVSNLL